ncbi:MAG: molybdopterin molybdotransferase MoeA [Deltaproteobacteria bacterium]|nr:molybdopterin molybdotransferase MoeA [Deltaproteobacteria bacterium]
MKTVKEAQDIILKNVSALGTEKVRITGALGRILAEKVFANRDHPPFDSSAMDGYAVRFEDVKGATRGNPAALEIIDDIKAGGEPKRSVEKGVASRIMTGAPVPKGADTVVRVEDTDSSKDKVKVLVPPRKGSNIRPMGENLKAGDLLLDEGDELGPAHIGTLAMVKKKEVMVYRRPRVAVLSTGDELEGIDEPLDPKKIPDANSYTVMAELESLGAEPVLLGIARDTREALEEKLREGLKYDALVISGGVAVGQYDFVRPVLKDLKIDIRFWRVALRPGHPFAFGTGEKNVIFALPGNPVSTMVCCEEFIVPAVRKMMGAKRLFRRTIKAGLKEKVKDKKGRTHFMRALLEGSPSGYSARLPGEQGSGILMSMVKADGLLIVPQESEELKENAVVTVQVGFGFPFQEEPNLPEEKSVEDE